MLHESRWYFEILLTVFISNLGFLCCNSTLEQVMEEAFETTKSEGVSECNVQKMANAVQEVSHSLQKSFDLIGYSRQQKRDSTNHSKPLWLIRISSLKSTSLET